MEVLPPAYFFGFVAFFVWGYCWFVASFGGFCIAVLVCCYYSYTPHDVTGTCFPRDLLLALLEVFKGPWPPLGGRGEMAMAMVAGLHVSAVHQMLSLPSSRLQEEVLRRDPLAQRGRLSGLTKDMLNSLEGR